MTRLVASLQILLTLLSTSVSGQGFLIFAGSAARAGVTPFPEGVNHEYQSHETAGNLITDVSISDASSVFAASGETARGNADALANATASRLRLSVSGRTYAEYPTENPNSASGSQSMGFGSAGAAGAEAAIRIDDLIFAGPGSTVLGSLNLASTQLENSIARVSIVNGTSLISTTLGYTLLEFFSPSSLATSHPFGDFQIPVGVPLSLQVSLQGYSEVNVQYGQSSGSSNFSGDVQFPSIGHIFNLPNGYTVNSFSAQIADNQFVAVPEPYEHTLIAAMLAAAIAWNRRVRGKRIG